MNNRPADLQTTPQTPTTADEMNRQALEYHAAFPPGKLSLLPTKACATQKDLSLAYTPGVAAPCREIAQDPEAAWKYTSKGNSVAVISNGTAVLGLGSIGPLAGKPVMEGKALLLKRFADVDACDLDITPRDVETFCTVVEAVSPTFGGINLEDVKAPECFQIEDRLRHTLNIPAFHDDQHGTAIVTGAALQNALFLVGKTIQTAKFVFLGAGAAGLACANFYLSLGMKRENAFVFDREGLLTKSMTLNPWKAAFARSDEDRGMSLSQALTGADVFIGLSGPNLITQDMILGMAPNPIIFALANPIPEIDPTFARTTRPDAILATGRSDLPNQVNNVLGFPGIFRGALDTRSRTINEEMKRAASQALALLAREPPADAFSKSFGRDALLPSPLDARVVPAVAEAVAMSAMETDVARIHVDVTQYKNELVRRLSRQ